MKIELKQIVPIPLKDQFLQRRSAIWNTAVLFQEGEWIKIKAPSGTGKTTLIHTLYKLRHDYSGQILYDTKDVKNITGDELARVRQQKISVVFQDLRLFPHLSARENIELNRVLQPPYYESSMIDEMAEKLGVSHILQQRAGLCSYGEQQRIAIIRSLIQPFEWLLLDEPFSHLDQDNILKAGILITEECKKRNAGFILTDLDDDNHFEYTRHLDL
jgi:putative ABC transport system ATP-binding protein